MKQNILFSFVGGDERMRWAETELREAGFEITPFPLCTHVVLPLPAFRDGRINAGPALSDFLPRLSPGTTVLGGILEPHRIALEAAGCFPIDYYLHQPLIAANARLTAEAAIHFAADRLPVTLEHSPVLVCGWGRIGQLLAHKLRALGASVTVSARDPRDLGMIEALGFIPCVTGAWRDLSLYNIIYNTVPAPVFLSHHLKTAKRECLFIDLASTPGFAPTEDRIILPAPGLPGIYAPETAGRLIGKTVLELCHLERR